MAENELNRGWGHEEAPSPLSPQQAQEEEYLKQLAAKQKKATAIAAPQAVLQGTFAGAMPILQALQQGGGRNGGGGGGMPARGGAGKPGSLRRAVMSAGSHNQLYNRLERRGFHISETGVGNRGGVGGGHSPSGHHYAHPNQTADISFWGRKGGANNTARETRMLGRLERLLVSRARKSGADHETIFGGNKFNPHSADSSHRTHLHSYLEFIKRLYAARRRNGK